MIIIMIHVCPIQLHNEILGTFNNVSQGVSSSLRTSSTTSSLGSCESHSKRVTL